MMKEKFTFFVISFTILVFCLEIQTIQTKSSSIQKTIEDITSRLLSEQFTKNKTANPIGEKFIGLWPSYIHVNFVGDPIRTIMRNDVRMVDNNMFVTAWITELLLEANQMKFTSFPEENLNLAIKSLLDFRDKNYPTPSPIFSFWPQVENNGTYVADPVNLFNFLAFVNVSSTGNDSQAHAFYIPADFDDSSVSLAISCSLYEQKNEFGQAFTNWSKENFGPSPSSSISYLSSALKSYSYQPFSNDSNINLIDPRTYYWISDYLSFVYDKSKEEGYEANVTLITTWILDIDINRQSYYKLYSMPFNVNNVDGSVVANTIYSLTRAILSDQSNLDWFDSDLQKIYFDSAFLLSWIVEKELLNWRPDLILLYYMGNYNFYWFVSRTLFLLNSAPSLPFPVMERVREEFERTLRTNATSVLYSSAQFDGDFAYWDNFIGVNDTTKEGEPINNANDRLCTTAVAIDALIYIWTTKTSNCEFEYVEETPSHIKSLIESAVEWLNKNIVYNIIGSDQHYLRENAFFSGSVKGRDLPFYFPINFAQYLNGTNLTTYNELRDFQYISDDLIVGISGYIPFNQYQSMVYNEKWFGEETPVDWEGYNVSSNGTLIYWSAPGLTYATSINAFGKYLNTC